MLSDEQFSLNLLAVRRSCYWSGLLFIHHRIQTSRKKEGKEQTSGGHIA